MLKRTMDADYLNAVANHADVRPWLGGDEPSLDLSATLANPENVALVCEGGGFVGVKLEPGVYECHSLFLPEARGDIAKAAMVEGLRYLFVQTDCIDVRTKVPHGNKAAQGAARFMGFSPQFTLERGWKMHDGTMGGVDCLGLSFVKWLGRDTGVEAKGAWFHERLEARKAAHGSTIPAHHDEPAHNRAVGAAVLMFEAGNPIKAQAAYNQWARFAGYSPIHLLGLNPVVIDVVDAIVSIQEGDMEILLCR